MSGKNLFFGLLLVFAVLFGCRKKNNDHPNTPIAPLTEILPGIWNVVQFKGTSTLNLSGVEYQLERNLKDGTLSVVFNAGLSQMHFSGAGTFETSIKASGQILQKMDQKFGFSEQNSLYLIVSVGTNFLKIMPGISNGIETTAEIQRLNTDEIALTLSQTEQIENFGPIVFKNEYTLRRNP